MWCSYSVFRGWTESDFVSFRFVTVLWFAFWGEYFWLRNSLPIFWSRSIPIWNQARTLVWLSTTWILVGNDEYSGSAIFRSLRKKKNIFQLFGRRTEEPKLVWETNWTFEDIGKLLVFLEPTSGQQQQQRNSGRSVFPWSGDGGSSVAGQFKVEFRQKKFNPESVEHKEGIWNFGTGDS